MPMNQQAASPDQAKQLFEQGFSDMANNVLINKFPNIAQEVVTFKILNSDAESGSGVGAFVVVHGGQQLLYVPVVMADNQLKPMDVLFCKDLNVFLPLTKEWLAELTQMTAENMGSAHKPPATMSTDVDIRNVVIPPTTGRYSYANDYTADIEAMFAKIAYFDQGGQKSSYLDFIQKSPNKVKLAAAEYLEKNASLYTNLVHHFGHKAIAAAFTPRTEKVAAEEMPAEEKILIADQSTSPGEFKSIFGSESAMAFQGVRVKGYYAKDDRKKLNRPYAVQEHIELQQTKEAGVYKLWCHHGVSCNALVIPNVVMVISHSYPRMNGNATHGATPIGKVVGPRNKRVRPEQAEWAQYGQDCKSEEFVGVTEDGKLIWSKMPLLGQPRQWDVLAKSPIFKKAVGDTSSKPTAGSRGFFLLRKGASFTATEPFRVKSVTTGEDGLTRIDARPLVESEFLSRHDHEDRRSLIISASPGGSFVASIEHTVPVRVPSDAVWIPTTLEEGLDSRDFQSEPKDLLKWAVCAATESGGEKITVKKASDRGWTFGETSRRDYAFVPALLKLATDARISVDDAAAALKIAQLKSRCEFYVFNDKSHAALVKMAAEGAPPSKEKAKPEGGGQGGDPAGDAMGQVAAAPQAPQLPSPIDMAVAEQTQNIQMQMQGLQAQLQTLQMVQQRANMISGAGGAMGAPAAMAGAMAGPMDPSMTGQGGSMPPQQPMGGQPGQPQQGGQDPQMGAGQPGMGAPAAGGQMGGQPQQGQPQQPGAMGGQPQQGGGQQQGQPQQSATMTADDGSTQSLMQQVNPQFAEQAGQLQSAGAFDASMLSSMAQAPALKELVGSYMPVLEKALDSGGRMLLTLWMDEKRLKEDLGDETYVSLESNLRAYHRNLGDLILKIHQTGSVMRGPNDQNFGVH